MQICDSVSKCRWIWCCGSKITSSTPKLVHNKYKYEQVAIGLNLALWNKNNYNIGVTVHCIIRTQPWAPNTLLLPSGFKTTFTISLSLLRCLQDFRWCFVILTSILPSQGLQSRLGPPTWDMAVGHKWKSLILRECFNPIPSLIDKISNSAGHVHRKKTQYHQWHTFVPARLFVKIVWCFMLYARASSKSASVLMGKSLNFFLAWVRARARAPLIGSKTDTGGARARANPTKKKA